MPDDFDIRIKRTLKNTGHLRVVEIRFVPTPDADMRLQRALDILLRSDETPSKDGSTVRGGDG